MYVKPIAQYLPHNECSINKRWPRSTTRIQGLLQFRELDTHPAGKSGIVGVGGVGRDHRSLSTQGCGLSGEPAKTAELAQAPLVTPPSCRDEEESTNSPPPSLPDDQLLPFMLPNDKPLPPPPPQRPSPPDPLFPTCSPCPSIPPPSPAPGVRCRSGEPHPSSLPFPPRLQRGVPDLALWVGRSRRPFPGQT